MNRSLVAAAVLAAAVLGALVTYPSSTEKTVTGHVGSDELRDSQGRTPTAYMLAQEHEAQLRHEAYLRKEAGQATECADKLPVLDRDGKKIDYPQQTVDEYAHCQGFYRPTINRNGKEIYYKEN